MTTGPTEGSGPLTPPGPTPAGGATPPEPPPEPGLSCAIHGTATRLRCAECDTGICTKCMVRTDVGLKCPTHAAGVAPTFKPVPRKNYVLAAVGLAAVIGGAVAISLTLKSDDTVDPGEGAGTSGTVSTVEPAPGRIQVPQVFVMAADGSAPRTLTNRPLAFDGSPAWSPDGSRIAFDSAATTGRAIYVMAADGSGIKRLTEGPGSASYPAWSPDGNSIAYMRELDGNAEVYIMNVDGSNVRPVTDNAALDGFPAFTPDGNKLTYVSDRGGTPQLWSINTDGTNPQRLSEVGVVTERPSWTPDGARLVFTSDRDDLDPEIYTMNADGSGLTRLTSHPGVDGEPAVSPDGRTIAFASQRDGSAGVYVMAIDGSSVVRLTQGPRAFAPAWSPSGDQIVFVNDPGTPG